MLVALGGNSRDVSGGREAEAILEWDEAFPGVWHPLPHGSTDGVTQATESWHVLAVPQELRGCFLSHTFVIPLCV